MIEVSSRCPTSAKQIDARAKEPATLKDSRLAAKKTREQLAEALGVRRQDTIFRLERRSDMLLSILRHYVESMGGRLDQALTVFKRSISVIGC